MAAADQRVYLDTLSDNLKTSVETAQENHDVDLIWDDIDDGRRYFYLGDLKDLDINSYETIKYDVEHQHQDGGKKTQTP